MRAKAFENLVKWYSEVIESDAPVEEKMTALKNLSVKGRLLISRDPSTASVVRELVNR